MTDTLYCSLCRYAISEQWHKEAKELYGQWVCADCLPGATALCLSLLKHIDREANACLGHAKPYHATHLRVFQEEVQKLREVQK